MKFSEEFKEARKETELTQKELSKACEIPLRTIQNWEAGINEPPKYLQKYILQAVSEIE